ncbi:MAG: 3-dehydro-L-gulonate 2-dehydrogenase [Eubacteriales bacterium]
MRVKYEDMKQEFKRVLESRGFDAENAEAAATVFAQNSLDGIYSHGLNRFPWVVSRLDEGMMNPKLEPTCEINFGAIERWNGHQGFGPLNAKKAMNRACELAKEFGVGIVALGNNNHWMRGGSYGRQAAEAGCIAICWSNTTPNMPAWGAKDARIGNNPLVLAVPRRNGNHVVVDCAMSQFSYGKMEETRLKKEQLPVLGGYNKAGVLSTDPTEIEESSRVLPMGYWKGSGLSILLDLIGTTLTNGNSTRQVGEFGCEIGLTQIMIAIDASKFNTQSEIDAIAESLIADLKLSEPIEVGGDIRYPGEREFKVRQENLEFGIPVIEEKWEEVQAF